jgi:hypothetical protein
VPTAHEAAGVDLQLELVEGDGRFALAFTVLSGSDGAQRLLEVEAPVWIERWRAGDPESAIEVDPGRYDRVDRHGDRVQAEATAFAGRDSIRLLDTWTQVWRDTWRLDRIIQASDPEAGTGIRTRLELEAPADGARFADARFFAPPATYDRNDLDEDGVDDYLGTQSLSWREDRLNALSVLAFDPESRLAVSIVRAVPPAFDDRPVRPNRERMFLQRTDVGSLGWAPGRPHDRLRLRACYPFDEGERSHALLLLERPGWGAFWPVADAPTLAVSWLVRVERGDSFIDVAWSHFARRLRELSPDPVALRAPADELLRLRIEALDRYYLESDPAAEPRGPAGYVLNCHPQDGVQLADIIQYGFTGQNILNAFLALRFAQAHGDQEIGRRARRVIDFFVREAAVPGTGLFHDLYNVPRGRMDCWWTGLLLPLAYAQPGGSLEQLMGPLHRRWENEISQLQQIRGSYLRCMSESVHALLGAAAFEAAEGRSQRHWELAARAYGEFLLRAQEADGSWYRAYDHDGRPLTSPAIWFGTTAVEQRSSSATAIPVLLALAEAGGEPRFADAAIRAGRFVRTTLIDPVRFNGGIHDPIYAKGQLVDNEGILFPMVAMLGLHRLTGDRWFLEGAYNAARLFASWICLWDVPLPADSTLARYGFRSTGTGACDTCGAGYVHPFELLALPELIEIAQLTGDRALFDVAELAYGGCNQTLALHAGDWGYRYPGLQEEGYLVSWWLADDPMFDETEFGRRWKGEGNKTCFPWLSAVGMACHWKLLDRFGTADLDVIREHLGFSR